MTSYYVLDCMSPLRAEHYRFRVGYPANDKRWVAGLLFSATDESDTCQPPEEPIEVRTKESTEEPGHIYPELSWVPIPLMSRRLVEGLKAAGVDNLQTYETKLISRHGENPPPEDHYLAVNLVGVLAAADLTKSKTNPEVADKMISMDFFSLAIDPSKARNVLMFRLAENVSAVIVHERVKLAIEAQGISTLSWFRPEEWSG